MPRRPPVPLPSPRGSRIPTGRPSFRPSLEGPPPARQAQRLTPAFQRLSDALNEERLGIAGSTDAVDPELIVVMEIGGDLQDFINAIRRVRGLEFLADQAEDKLEPDEDFAVIDNEGHRRPYDRQLFVVASDHRAWQEILRLWALYQEGGEFARGLAPFRNLFSRLRVLRAWNDTDRLTHSGAASAWLQQFREAGDQLVPFEAELWFRAEGAKREAAVADIARGLDEAGGGLQKEVVVPEIEYHGVLGVAPAQLLVESASRNEVDWIRTTGVRLFHAIGQFAIAPVDLADSDVDVVDDEIDEEAPSGSPRIALLDGLPIENHALLRDRIIVDDPDGWAATTPAAHREHGTSMSSLILHGDLSQASTPIRSPLYVRPIIRRLAPDWVDDPRELMPPDELPVDLVRRAVVRMLDGEDAVAPDVKVIVMAVCDAALMYSRFVSPLARLLDWLSHEYGVLFVLSGGNQDSELAIPRDTSLDSPEEVQHEVLASVFRNRLSRRLLSPAESINAVTVGAAHADESGATAPPGLVEPMSAVDSLSVVSPVGAGHLRSIKPDILVAGGRQLARTSTHDGGGERVTLSFPASRRAPGLRAGAPSSTGDLTNTRFACGTSGAAALAGRGAAELLTQIEALRNEWAQTSTQEDLDPVLIKALLAHSASWGSARDPIQAVIDELRLGAPRDALAALLGYGRADPFDALDCDDNRITALRAARIDEGRIHAYALPLPPSLDSSTVQRRLTLTLAWISPINPKHSRYRRARLRLHPPAGGSELFGTRSEAAWTTTRRGTLQHEILEGDRAIPFTQGDTANVTIECRSDAGELLDPVPYALVLTVETPSDPQLPIYDEVRIGLRTQVGVRTRPLN
jgi:hypothetical protein